MRQLAGCVGLLCLVTGVMEVKVRVRVQEVAGDPVSTSRQGRQLSFNGEGWSVIPMFVVSLATATLQNIVYEVLDSGWYIFEIF